MRLWALTLISSAAVRLNAAGQKLPKSGKVFISVKNSDKEAMVLVAKNLVDMGFEICQRAELLHFRKLASR